MVVEPPSSPSLQQKTVQSPTRWLVCGGGVVLLLLFVWGIVSDSDRKNKARKEEEEADWKWLEKEVLRPRLNDRRVVCELCLAAHTHYPRRVLLKYTQRHPREVEFYKESTIRLKKCISGYRSSWKTNTGKCSLTFLEEHVLRHHSSWEADTWEKDSLSCIVIVKQPSWLKKIFKD
jgi:hypothetical protein